MTRGKTVVGRYILVATGDDRQRAGVGIGDSSADKGLIGAQIDDIQISPGNNIILAIDQIDITAANRGFVSHDVIIISAANRGMITAGIN